MQRFRTHTLARALDVLEQALNNAKMVALVEEMGCGEGYDQLDGPNRTTPKLRNLLQQTVRRSPERTDIEGNPLTDALVRRAAKNIPDQDPAPWGTADESPIFSDFRASLAVDGWTVEKGELAPITPAPLRETASRLRKRLGSLHYADAANRLDQLEHSLDAGHWESANSDTRSFLASVLTAIAHQRAGPGVHLEEGKARTWLEGSGFFKADPGEPGRSLEGEFVKKLFGLLGSEGSHAGATDQETAIYRYGVAVLTADYFLQR